MALSFGLDISPMYVKPTVLLSSVECVRVQLQPSSTVDCARLREGFIVFDHLCGRSLVWREPTCRCRL